MQVNGLMNKMIKLKFTLLSKPESEIEKCGDPSSVEEEKLVVFGQHKNFSYMFLTS